MTRSPSQSTENVGESCFSADRKWVLGKKKQPLSAEKYYKTPKEEGRKVTHFAQSQDYKLVVFDGLELRLSYTSTREMRLLEHRLEQRLAAIIVTPVPGFFVLLMQQAGIQLIDSKGCKRDFPKVAYPITSSTIDFILTDNILYMLAGSQFGHLICFEIKPQSISDRFTVPVSRRGPISSISHSKCNGQQYLLVATFFNLIVLEWNDFNQEPRVLREISRPKEDQMVLPTFVGSNETYVAWFTHEGLFIYGTKRLIDGKIHSALVERSALESILGEELHLCFSTPNPPIIVTKYYAFIHSSSMLIAVDLKSGQIVFQFPTSSVKINCIQHNFCSNCITIVTSHHSVFKVDLSNEQPYTPLEMLCDHKSQAIQECKPTRYVHANEILFELLQQKDWDRAIEWVKSYIGPLTNVREDFDAPGMISKSQTKRLCLQTLVYELQLLKAVDKNSTNTLSLKLPEVYHGDYDLIGNILYLLRIRSFLGIGSAIESLQFTSDTKSPAAIQFLVEQKRILEAIDYLLRSDQPLDSIHPLVIESQECCAKLVERLDIPKIRNLIVELLPFIHSQLEFRTLRELIILETREKHPIDVIIHAICSKQNKSSSVDEELFSLLTERTGSVLFNPVSIFESLRNAGLFHSAAEAALRASLFKEAALCGQKIDTKQCSHYILQAPKSMRAALATEFGIVFEKEGSKSTVNYRDIKSVTEELARLKEKIKKKERKAKECAKFLRDLESAIGLSREPEPVCVRCKKPLHDTIGVAFPCGHSYHNECLCSAVMQVLTSQEQVQLSELLRQKTLTKAEQRRKEVLLADDCPYCGMKSADLIYSPLLVDHQEEWTIP